MTETSTFFRGRRLSVYCKGGRLGKDAKTDVRYWRLKLALTLTAEDVYASGGAIQSNYEQIQARENFIGKIATFFAVADNAAPQLLRLAECFVDQYAMTYADGMTELWLRLEHKNTDALHRFVKDYAFSRFYVEFEEPQRSLTEMIAQKAGNPDNPLQRLADREGVTTSIEDADGNTIGTFKPKGRPN